MALIIRELIKNYHYLNTELSDPRMKDYVLISTPFPMIAIVGFYLYIVTDLGPRIMKDRQPFKLDRVLRIYNVFQIALSSWLVIRGVKSGWCTTYSWTCEPIDYSTSPTALYVLQSAYFYYLVKISDLADTVFFVLRKKSNQVSFLHVFHHAGMVQFSWYGTKYVGGGHGTLFGFLNSIVHVVMYTYYLVTSIYPEQRNNIWWKKYITQLQMIQFLINTLHSLQLFFRNECGYPLSLAATIIVLNGVMFVLFSNFYRKTYNREKLSRH